MGLTTMQGVGSWFALIVDCEMCIAEMDQAMDL